MKRKQTRKAFIVVMGDWRILEYIGYVGTLDVGSLERQVVGVLVVEFPKYQQCNVNLDYLTSWVLAAQCKPTKNGWSGNGGPAASPIIKSVKI